MISKFPNESLNPSPPSAGTGTGIYGHDASRADFLDVPALATLRVSLRDLLQVCHSLSLLLLIVRCSTIQHYFTILDCT